MRATRLIDSDKQWFTGLFVAILTAGVSLVPIALSAADVQKTFATAQDAIQATIDAAERHDTTTLLQLFGPGGKEIVLSGDAQQDQESQTEFAQAAREKLQIHEDRLTPDRVTFSVGREDWPFPVPVIRKNGKWQLDSASGKVEILARRIGRNELNAMEICRGYAEAQLEYASRARDGDEALKYAQKIISSPGRHDGLYAEGAADNLVPRAFAEATVGDSSVKPKPYHGYFFRVLKAQGPGANGGAFSYVVNSNMIGGFALVAWPAEYGVSGIRTFLINHDGVVYEKDLGASTATRVLQMKTFSPDNTWHSVVLE